jgi:ABC-type branched-subunit amino acid transport system ATPase component
MLETRNLSSGYGEARVINNVSLSLGPGDTVAILGRNGVGKTTFLKSVFGLCDVHEGAIFLDGRTVPSKRPEYLASRGISLMPDDRGVFATLTIEENLRVARRADYTPAVDVRELFPLLKDRPAERAGVLSGGQKQQLGIARAILAGKRLIAIDELSQGLSPSVVSDVISSLNQLALSGVAVVIVEQTPSIALSLCDRIIVMLDGHIILDEGKEALENSPKRLDELLVVG